MIRRDIGVELHIGAQSLSALFYIFLKNHCKSADIICGGLYTFDGRV